MSFSMALHNKTEGNELQIASWSRFYKQWMSQNHTRVCCYPNCTQRATEALEEERTASFAFLLTFLPPMLEAIVCGNCERNCRRVAQQGRFENYVDAEGPALTETWNREQRKEAAIR